MSTGNLSAVGVSSGAPSAFTKFSGFHEWLSLENRRVKQWWAARSSADLHKLYLNQLQDTDELRSQLNDQLRALDGRVDTQVAIVVELQDWVRRRADLHQEYATKLDKMAKSLHARHKEQKTRREQWNLFSVFNCYQALVNQTKKDAKDHSSMAEVCISYIIPRLSQVQEDVQRIYKKCREIAYECHEELLKVLHELHTTMRTYHTYQAEAKNAETKLRNFELQRTKLLHAISKEKLEKSKKFRVIEKEIQKRGNKHKEAKLKALKARNEYILSMDSANSAIHKYFVDDLSDLIDDCMNQNIQAGIEELMRCLANLDSRLDKQRFLEYNNNAFMLPKKFEFQAHKGDEVHLLFITRDIQAEMEERYSHLAARLTGLRTESEEMWKTIETAEKTLIEMIDAGEIEMCNYFDDDAKIEPKQPESVILKLKADRQETEVFYLGKFHQHTGISNLVCRLQARNELLRKALRTDTSINSSPTPIRSLANKPRRRRIGRLQMGGQPKLFGGSLEEYLEATGQEIPLIMKSCIRVINLYGLHHQGIFRVSGSQLEINNFRDVFERMEDPLAEVSDASDINSVAGVLKLYLRELREPLFPTVYFEQFMEIAQFSDENMMDPYNLAICFGPTLVPIPEDKDQVQYQNLVNELIKNIIIFAEDIFPASDGLCYEKYISRDSIDLEADVGDAPIDPQEDGDSEHTHSDDECDILEAVAQFDFIARSDRELSFSKGDTLILHSQVSSDWWKGTFQGKYGLIPDKYILLRIRDDEKERLNERNTTEDLVSNIASSDMSVSLSEMSTSSPPLSPTAWKQNEDSKLDRKLPEHHMIVTPNLQPSSQLSFLENTDKMNTGSENCVSRSPKPSDQNKGSQNTFVFVEDTANESVISDVKEESPVSLQNQRRSYCNSGSSSSSEERLSCPPAISSWEQRSKIKAPQGAPDLVMDLPISSLSFSPKDSSPRLPHEKRTRTVSSSSESSSGKQSPDIATGAECFASQNQSTLKKTPASKSTASLSTDAQTQTQVPSANRVTESASELQLPDSFAHSSDSAKKAHVEVRSISDDKPPSVLSPSTPRLAARYLQAVAAASGDTNVVVRPNIKSKTKKNFDSHSSN